MRIIFSTRNPSKLEQVAFIFAGTGISVVSLSEAGIVGEAVEDGTTLQENSLKKALFAHKQAPDSWTMADDTGLFIRALNGEPGIKAARWAGETATTEEVMRYTLKRLEGAADRSAVFETVVSMVSPGGHQHFFSGKVPGMLLESPRVPPQPKMPYSGIFLPDGENQVWAEMTVEYENTISHRGKAFGQAKNFLQQQG